MLLFICSAAAARSSSLRDGRICFAGAAAAADGTHRRQDNQSGDVAEDERFNKLAGAGHHAQFCHALQFEEREDVEEGCRRRE